MHIRSFVFFVLILLVLPALSFSSSAANLNPKETANAINAEIAKQNLGWVADETSVSGLPLEQKEMLLMVKKAAPAGKKPSKIVAKSVGTPSPSSTDWRSKEGLDWVTPVRDQGGCGACWAFSSIAIMESKIRIELNNSNYDIDLAEQEVLSCNPFGSNCNGGLEVYALEYMRRNGTISESCFPYEEKRVACSDKCAGWQNEIVKVLNYTVLPADAASFKQTINEQGPITVWMEVYDDFFSYSSGVYQKAWGTLRGYHSIALVGYNDSGQYWIVKNSWGTGWGEGGYFRISYSENNLNSTDPGLTGVFYLDDSYSVTSTDIDTIAPTSSATAFTGEGSPYAFNTWSYSPYVNITLSCSDGTGSGCNSTLYCTDASNTCMPNIFYSSPVQISTNLISYIRYFSNDSLGNKEAFRNHTIMIDTAAPSSNAIAVNSDSSTYTFNTWTNSPYVNVTLSCLDGSGSGCDAILYCNDTTDTCIPNLVYSAPVRISTLGISYIRYFSNDTVGNSESSTSKTIMIDTVIPTVTIISPANRIYFTSFIELNFTSVNGGAGIDPDKCFYKVDSGALTAIPGCGNMTLPSVTDGWHTIIVYSNDSTDNQGSSTVSFAIDAVAPSITIFTPANITYNAWNISFKFNASASFWNLSSCWYSLDSGINTSAPCKNFSTIIWLLNGVHNITVYANDTNGFVGSSTVSPTINSPATINVTVAKPRLWTKFAFNFFSYNLTFREFKPANCSLINASNVTIAKSTPFLNGTYSFYANLPFGSPNGFYPYTILCYHMSFAAFRDSEVVNVSYDNTVPKVTALLSGSWTNKSLVNVSYNVTDNLADKIACNLTYGIKKFSANVTNNTIRTESVNLTTQGLNTLSILCSDYAGNLGFASGTIGLDSIAPTVSVNAVPLTLNANGTKNVYFFYSITEANAMNLTTYSIDSAINGSLGTTKSGSFIVPLFPGNHSIHFDSYDQVLNRGFIDKNFTVK